MKMKKLIAAVLALTLILSSISVLSGCSDKGMTKKELISGTIGAENMRLEKDGVAFEISEVTFSEDTKATISTVKNAPDFIDAPVTAYDFTVETDEAPAGVMLLTLPHKAGSNEMVCAAYLNEETGAWEPVAFEYDREKQQAVIMTDHLSTYGVFTVNNENTRRAALAFTDPGYLSKYISAEESVSLLQSCAEILDTTKECLDVGATIFGEFMFPVNDIGLLGVDMLGYVMKVDNGRYTYDFGSKLGDSLGNVGLVVAAYQVCRYMEQGEEYRALGLMIKTPMMYTFGKVARGVGTTSMKACMLAVAIIDYSLNAFAEEAVSGRRDIYDKAYRLYYTRGGDGYRSATEWYKILYPLFNGNYSPEEVNDEVDKLVVEYVNQFWKNESTVAYYMDQATKLGFTGGGGLNETIKKQLSDEHRGELYNGLLQPVMTQIGRQLQRDARENLNKAMQEVTDQLNTVVTLEINDLTKKKDYDGMTVRFKDLPGSIQDPEKWEAVFKTNKAKISFTVFAHLQAGAPVQMEIVNKKDEVVYEFKVTIDPPYTVVEIEAEATQEEPPEEEAMRFTLRHSNEDSLRYPSETVFNDIVKQFNVVDFNQNSYKISLQSYEGQIDSTYSYTVTIELDILLDNPNEANTGSLVMSCEVIDTYFGSPIKYVASVSGTAAIGPVDGTIRFYPSSGGKYDEYQYERETGEYKFKQTINDQVGKYYFLDPIDDLEEQSQ